MLQRFDRAILAEFFRNATLFFFALLAILATLLAIRLLGRSAEGSLPVDLLIFYFPWALAHQIALVVVLSGFAAALLTYQRLMRDQEWAVWRSLGVSRLRFLRPMLVVALGAVPLTFWLASELASLAERKKEELRALAKSRDEASQVAPGVFRITRSGERVLFVGKRGGEAGPFFFRYLEGAREIIAVAERAAVEQRADGRWLVLRSGARYELYPDRSAFKTTFAELSVWLSPILVEVEERVRALSFSALFPLAQSGNLAAQAELAMRLGLALGAAILLCVALPLAETDPRTHRSLSLLLAVVVFLLHTQLLSLMHAAVARGQLAMLPALLLPPAVTIFIALGAWVWFKRAVP